MAPKRFNVIYTGIRKEGKFLGALAARVLASFRKDTRFPKKNAVVLANVDYETAAARARELEEMGGAWRIEPAVQAKARVELSTAPGEAPYREECQPTVVDPEASLADVLFSPRSCRQLGGDAKGLDLNKADQKITPYEGLLLVSVFADNAPANDRYKLLLFMRDSDRSFVAEASKIRYQDFPGVPGAMLMASLRNFVGFLCNQKPGLMVDADTHRFLLGAPPKSVGGGTLEHATALGRLLSSEKEFLAARERAARPRTSPFAQDFSGPDEKKKPLKHR
ncbi:MAG: hypothetical protein ABIM40_00695 [Pseudomonadota bacterium]